jgi:hypothetical protein
MEGINFSNENNTVYKWRSGTGSQKKTSFKAQNCAGISRTQIEIFDLRIRILGSILHIGDKKTAWYEMDRVPIIDDIIWKIKKWVQEDFDYGHEDVFDHVAVTPEIAAHLFALRVFDIYGLKDAEKYPDYIRINKTSIFVESKMVPIVITPSEKMEGFIVVTRDSSNKILE